MDIRASEISAILKDQIANFGAEADVAEVGQVLSVSDGVARIQDTTVQHFDHQNLAELLYFELKSYSNFYFCLLSSLLYVLSL